MKRFLLAQTIFLIILFSSFISRAQEAVQLTGNFVGTIRLGPDQNKSWQGLLTLTVDEQGAITGTLEQSSGETLTVSGTVTGQDITLIFELENGKYVIGTGGPTETFTTTLRC
jgi:hypothetical protein